MEDRLHDLYRLPDISQLEDVHLLTLREHCAMLEEQVTDMFFRISEHDRQILEAYFDGVEMVHYRDKAA